MRQKLSTSTQLPLELFLTFNRVKTLLSDKGADDQARITLLQQAIKKSDMLKLSKCGKLVKRRIPFNIKRVDKTQMDQSTVYVENFPE